MNPTGSRIRPDIADVLLPLDEASDIPLYRQIYAGLRTAILEGRLPPGARIPSTRRLAEYLAVSRTTVLVAFDRLTAEGFLVGTVGSGSRVANHILPRPAPDLEAPAASPVVEAVSRRGRRLLDLPRPARPRGRGPHPFRLGQPPVDGFPLEVWRRLSSRVLRAIGTADLYHGAAAGLERLREAIVTVALARGIRCEPRQVLVLGSAQEGMELIARILLDPGEAAWIEEPAWSGARSALVAAGAELVPVPVDHAGLRVAEGIEVAPGARLAYVTPSHQFPLGVTLSLERRRMLLDWAASQGAWVLEDDYDSEFRYADRPVPALQGLDDSGRVIYLGTFNKILFPALRLAYLILPDALVEPMIRARSAGGQHSPVLDQAVLAAFIADGHLSRHLKHVRELGRQRRDALTSAVGGIDGLTFSQTDTGLHAVAWLPDTADDRRVSDAALRHDVEAPPLSGFYLGPCPRPGLVLGYGSLTEPQITDGVRRLGAAIACAADPGPAGAG